MRLATAAAGFLGAGFCVATGAFFGSAALVLLDGGGARSEILGGGAKELGGGGAENAKSAAFSLPRAGSTVLAVPVLKPVDVGAWGAGTEEVEAGADGFGVWAADGADTN